MTKNYTKEVIFSKTYNVSGGGNRNQVSTYTTNDEKEIKTLLHLAGINKNDYECDHDVCDQEDCGCECHSDKKEILQYNLENFSNELRSTFDSVNFENWLDCFKNFRMKLINKGFSPEASERIVLEVLSEYYKKKNVFEDYDETECDKNIKNNLDQEVYLSVSLNKDGEYAGGFNASGDNEKELKEILKLAGLVIDDLVSDTESENSECEKNSLQVNENVEENEKEGMYMLELNLKNKHSSKDKKILGKVKLIATNETDLENAVDMLINYMQEMKNKGLNKSDFKIVKNREEFNECEIIVDRSPYMIGDRRIFAHGSLDTLNTRMINQKFVRYGDNSLTYEEEKNLLEEKLRKKYKKFSKKK